MKNDYNLVEVTKIKIPKHQLREQVSTTSITELANSIKRHGLLQPILVSRGKRGTFQLIAGLRRLLAVKMLKQDRVKALVIDDEVQKNRLKSAVENIQRENVTAIEEAQYFRYLMDEYNMTEVDIAREIDKTVAYVSQRIRLLNSDKELQEAVATNTIDFSVAREIMTVENDALRKQFIDFATKSGATVEAVKKWKEAYAEMPEEEREAVPVEEMAKKVAFAKCDFCAEEIPTQALAVFRICGDCAKTAVEAVSS